MRLSRLLLVLPLLGLLACDDGPNDGGETPGTTSDSGAGTDSDETPTTNPGDTSGNTSSGTSASTTSASGTTTPGGETTDDGSESSTSGTMTTTSGTGGGESSTGEVPTSGPGVLPGEDGMQAQCRRALECGSTYYRDEQDCIDAGVDYWGECAEATAALNNFGACMSEMDCADYNPDAYNPANTPCSELWSDLQDAGPC